MSEILVLDETDRKRLIKAINDMPLGLLVSIRRPRRTSVQNRLYWALCGDIAKQVDTATGFLGKLAWDLFFRLKYLTPEVIELPDGSIRHVEPSTKDLTVQEFSDLIDQVMAFASERGVVLDETTRRATREALSMKDRPTNPRKPSPSQKMSESGEPSQ